MAAALVEARERRGLVLLAALVALVLDDGPCMGDFVGRDEPGTLLFVPVRTQGFERLFDRIRVARKGHRRGRWLRLLERIGKVGQGIYLVLVLVVV